MSRLWIVAMLGLFGLALRVTFYEDPLLSYCAGVLIGVSITIPWSRILERLR